MCFSYSRCCLTCWISAIRCCRFICSDCAGCPARFGWGWFFSDHPHTIYDHPNRGPTSGAWWLRFIHMLRRKSKRGSLSFGDRLSKGGVEELRWHFRVFHLDRVQTGNARHHQLKSCPVTFVFQFMHFLLHQFGHYLNTCSKGLVKCASSALFTCSSNSGHSETRRASSCLVSLCAQLLSNWTEH